jgi:YggT family protein
MLVLARFILQVVRADFYNPVSQFIVRATSPVLTPMRRVIPGFGGLDIACLVLLVLLVIIKIGLVWVLRELPWYPLSFILFVVKSLANSILNFFIFTIFISVILSWIVQGSYNPAADIIRQLTSPVLDPARKLLPPMGGLDFSPMIVLLGLWAIKIFFGLSGMI